MSAHTADRTRAIKKTLEAAFGRGKVAVRTRRGSGWLSINIDWTPLDIEQSREMKGHCKALLRAAGVDLGRAYTDDTCQWEMDRCHLNFNQCRYHRTMRHSDGTLSVMRDYGMEWEAAA